MAIGTNDPLGALWLPFTANRAFRKDPRIIVGAQGHHYCTQDQRRLYDGFSGLWTSGLGHCHPGIVKAVREQVGELDYSMGFQMANDKALLLADRVVEMAPSGLERCFFVNSGSEGVDTALKIALAYHRAQGHATRTRLIGRERGYHGVNFGGISVGGIGPNRKMFATGIIPGVDHLPHTGNPEVSAFSRGQPAWGVHLADELERLATLHDPENIAAVIVEPVAGSAGILPPPMGYLERLREICTRHGILLIFDEVITAFGRVGYGFAAQRFGVTPDVVVLAKGITNGVIPMGAVLVSEEIYQAFMHGPPNAIELFHGYTYSGHPVAAAAGLAALNAYEQEGAFEQARTLEGLFENCLHSLADHPKVVSVRNLGLMGGVDLAPGDAGVGARGMAVFLKCFHERDLVIRNTVDTLQFAPFLNAASGDLERMFAKVREVLDEID